MSGKQAPNSAKEDTAEEIIKMKQLHMMFDSMVSKTGIKYKPIHLVGKGGFGQVYECMVIKNGVTNNRIPDLVALKTETVHEIGIEMAVLRKLQDHNHFCDLYDYGYISSSVAYIVMTLLGPNLSNIRKQMPTKQFTVSTAIRAALQMLMAIESLHGAGFISRDVKPSNFAIGRPGGNKRMVYMIDFGIALVYRDERGTVKLRKSQITWRGTNRYCAIGHHKKQIPSPKDDLESWFYSLMELCMGELPWQHFGKHQKAETCRMKEVVRTSKRERFLGSAPFEFDQIMGLIDKMTRDGVVEYHKIYAALTRCLIRDGIDFKDPYDWEFMLPGYDANSNKETGGSTVPVEKFLNKV
ncbi:unnamed protein product [Bursaphelenchus xylophilus]|uniref:(pine wood nematode) hypothetical protein n=1 Tax=Bursaphelenchus xylophilus TaxID=6326 RepID=A0A1I7SLS1_BURXY|nr:unnamed protein product [Bursaphelenchus xylophilus]CAG9129717.1 unnamed protein product [Bursaphelenchus xylophilus]